MNIVLSICVASYNKAGTTLSLVKSILTCDNPELEVVVVDNASTDDTIAQLTGIKDSRLRVKRNEENIGGAPNIAKSIFAGEGQFCFYVNDRDIVYPEKLDNFINFLKCNPDIGGGHCVRRIITDKGQYIIHQGKDGIIKMAFRDEHPTGYFFKKSLLEEIPAVMVEKYVKPANYATFFWENFICEILCKGYPVAQYNDVIWKSTGDTTHAKYVSGFVSMDDGSDRWFYADHCLRRVIGNTDDVFRLAKQNGIIFNKHERYYLYAHLIRPEYALGVYRNKVVHETPSLAYHYKVSNRNISKKEMNHNRRIIIDGYIEYVREREGMADNMEMYIFESIKEIDKTQRLTLRRFLSRLKSVLIK